ncbi:hypothetical protein [Anaerotalea alkaliphila]|uniref:Uncharacterized protein n=1 Tax=Anaerotalea alkaliphila TaxID=2662126 RepID=A0A7X5HWB7_9FIRM|nr:hypothetical protein [Anaerotalea alkaliphila]NDL67853.1 hypothetical protein [Anaerotalea alkaliphila]
MDMLALGFVTVLAVAMGVKILEQYRTYAGSVHQALYSNFTEYRMRKGSREALSESYRLKKLFGPHRIVHMEDGGTVLLLTSGCYAINGENGVGDKFPWEGLRHVPMAIVETVPIDRLLDRIGEMHNTRDPDVLATSEIEKAFGLIAGDTLE